MNYPIAAACGLTLLAFLAHMTGGIRESLSIRPSKVASASFDRDQLVKLNRNWVQSMCAFQLVSIDLLALAGILYLLGFTDLLAPKALIGFALAGWYFLWGCVWLLQLAALRQKPKEYLFLGHWAFWFGCAGLIYWGSTSL
ncbi:MAG: hypothetical protein ACKOF9_16515 [Burkholderiales bacterium]